MSESVYVESSVISYLTAQPSRDVVVAARQAITETWWSCFKDNYDVFVSILVEQEITKGDIGASKRRLAVIQDIPHIFITPEAEALAAALINEGAVFPQTVKKMLFISPPRRQRALTTSLPGTSNTSTMFIQKRQPLKS